MESSTPSIARERMSQPDQIAAALRTGARTVREIADATGLSENHVRAILCRYPSRFVRVGQAEGRARAGRWGLLAPANSDKAT